MKCPEQANLEKQKVDYGCLWLVEGAQLEESRERFLGVSLWSDKKCSKTSSDGCTTVTMLKSTGLHTLRERVVQYMNYI